jgi:prohibitin 1
MTFGKEFTTAVEQKQIAQQDAERAKFIVEMVSSTRHGRTASQTEDLS